MTLTPDQERDIRASLEQMGLTNVREDLKQGRFPPAQIYLVSRWASDKEREENLRRETSISEQMELMRRASSAAERQATAAERANTRATTALIIAIISMIVTIIGIWVTHLDVHK